MKKLFALFFVFSVCMFINKAHAQSLPFTGSGYIDQDMCYNKPAVVKQPLSLTGGNTVYGKQCPVYVTMFIASKELTCTTTNPDINYQLLKVGTGNEWCLYFTIETGSASFTISDGSRSSTLVFLAK